jgi:hypothetical protein
MKIRLKGAAMLALCAYVLHRIHMLVHVAPWHQASPLELTLGLVAVLSGVAGAAFFLVGPALFRPYAWPPPDGD